MDERNVTDTIKTINRVKRSLISRVYGCIRLGDCRCKGSDNWYVIFVASDEEWETLVNKLQVKRVWSNEDIPSYLKGMIYSTD